MPGMMEKGPELLGKNRSANGSAKSPAGGGGGGASSTNGGLHYSEPESGCSSDDEHGDVGMRVGAEYQARIPEFDPGSLAVTGFQPGRGLGESSAYGGALAGASRSGACSFSPPQTLFSSGFG
ncbi:REST corepressor 3-like isoform X1 [Mustela nigripes]|uniref:REST corepressor 3-like isoform X1 n=1 Tax=Mustela nigripes TaxID=77151 RepID=UPI00281610EF|nr:REST corepressor 3-like isoform X1 [Mustela nigripes]